MKNRPRRIEREVATRLSIFFLKLGMSEVERIPVLGRTGPDISINEFGLVVDVKSRVEVPKSFVGLQMPGLTEELVAVPMRSVDHVIRFDIYGSPLRESLMVRTWWEHMDEWRMENLKDGYTALVLHRPGIRIDDASLVISHIDWRKIRERFR